MEAAADIDEMKERRIFVPNYNPLNVSIVFVICNLARLTDLSFPLRFENFAPEKTLEDSFCVNVLDTRYAVHKFTPCEDNDLWKDPFLLRWGVKFLKNVVTESLFDAFHHFTALLALQAVGTPYSCHKDCLQMYLMRRRDSEYIVPRNVYFLRPLRQQLRETRSPGSENSRQIGKFYGVFKYI